MALFWGTQSKITGAGLLLASVLISNIVYAARKELLLSTSDLALIYVIIDLGVAWVFVEIYRRSTRWDRGRWAAVLAAIQLSMVCVNFIGWVNHEFIRMPIFGLSLNLLTIAALIVCLIGFMPKSASEARDVLLSKLLFLRHDLFRRVLVAFQNGRRSGMFGRKNGESTTPIDAHVGKRIREARKQRDMTLSDLSAELGVSPAQLQKYEIGASRVSAGMLFFLSKFFGTDMKFFFEGFDGDHEIDWAQKRSTQN